MQGIYAIKNKINGKLYIGQSINMEQRKIHHFGKSSNPRLHHDMKTLGKENFEFEVLEVVQDGFSLVEREQYYLDLYADRLYNRKEKAKVSAVFKTFKI